MKKFLFAIFLLVLVPYAFAWTVSWDAVTSYTDNTPINDDNVVYDAWENGNPIATGIVGTSATFTSRKGELHNMEVRARLVRQGTYSDNGFLAWTSPAGKGKPPANLRVAP